ncbi:hypothetical protein ACEUZ9_000307 [Paracoccus litorisediminis]|uniref:hypothetical protein n=1 Tax=Paracoccus litorisediminis TaxID=2006130 RepID=UPI003734507A
MRGPRPHVPPEDRFLECEEALEEELLALIDRAVAAGWDRPETLSAITSLVDNIALGDQAMDMARLRHLLRRAR